MSDATQYFCFKLKQQADVDEITLLLEGAGLTVLYSSEEDDATEIVAAGTTGLAIDKLKTISAAIDSVTFMPLLETDWQSQWAMHGHDFHDGFVHIDLSQFADENLPILRLQPGPGFGDLSHPTTRLMLQLMPPHVKDKKIYDIGCGSGILAICAAALGASQVIGIDIDPDAILHAKQNAQLNSLQQQTTFILPQELEVIPPSNDAVALMNMIHTEQIAAWESLPQIHASIKTVITSGILPEARESYLTQCQKWGWKLVEEFSLEGWLAFFFERMKDEV